ncbi:MAG: RNA 3'-terminal phosphate cyclase [Theionarchaea archaeon]|nr:RNA 3'-terminal phosphate cyclase [Theionarchaea archaeon]
MHVIDGSYGEAGGQILRTSVTLSALTGTPCTITNIRASRPAPGLKPQHLMGLKAAAQICRAETKGFHIGSETVEFAPTKIVGGDYTVPIKTAGSVTLILQVLVPICLHASDTVTLTITGGTDVKWSPTMSYIRHVFTNILKKMNAHVDCTVQKYGFYPKGGGSVKAVIHPWEERKPLKLTERGPVQKIDVDSVAARFLQKAQVAERQSTAFCSVLSQYPVDAKNKYVDTLNPGSSFCAAAYCEHSVLGADSLGEKRKPAEKVGKEAAVTLKKELESGSALDTHMGDQIIPYLALVGGKVTVSRVSEHTKTNIWVCQQFLDTTFTVDRTTITAVLK